jgi:hypothetical protein
MVLQFVNGQLKYDLSSDPVVGPETAKIILLAQISERLQNIDRFIRESDVELDILLHAIKDEVTNVRGDR